MVGGGGKGGGLAPIYARSSFLLLKTAFIDHF